MIKKIKYWFLSTSAKNIYWINIGNSVTTFAGFVFIVIVARKLSPINFGIFSAVTSLTLIISELGELGISSALSRFLPPLIISNKIQEIRAIIKTTFMMQLVISLLFMIIVMIFSSNISQLLLHSGKNSEILMIKIASIGIVVYMIYNFISGVLNAFEEFKKMILFTCLFALPKVIVFLPWFYALLNPVFALLAFLLGPIMASLFGIYKIIKNYIVGGNFYSISKILNFSVYLGINKLFVTLFSRLDIIMLSSMTTSYDAGIYSAASRISFFFPMLAGSFGNVLAPKFAKLTLQQSLSSFKKIYSGIFLLVILVFISVLLSPLIIQIIYGNLYSSSTKVLQILLLSSIPLLLTIPINSIVSFNLKKPGVLVFSSAVQLLLIFCLNIILIPLFNIIAPAISIMLATSTALFINAMALMYFKNKNE